jgi:hypothetical protein
VVRKVVQTPRAVAVVHHLVRLLGLGLHRVPVLSTHAGRQPTLAHNTILCRVGCHTDGGERRLPSEDLVNHVDGVARGHGGVRVVGVRPHGLDVVEAVLIEAVGLVEGHTSDERLTQC